ncbi:MAG TPA: ABC transporter permease [Acetobacteraceae bacterium]|jgi:ABC-2 type transport system permease protein|nr:ABC transporter permease [Acetobacteraceae bacterium]
MSGFSLTRIVAMLVKEFRQMMRGTPSVLLLMPIIQLMLFGYAINDNPHHLPTGVFVQDQGEFSRSVLAAIRNTGYFDIVATARSSAELDRLMALGEIDFSVTIPGDFTRRVVRRDNAQILIEADAADPSATGSAVAALATLPANALTHDLVGTLAPVTAQPAFTAVVHNRYNPEGITSYNIVPGLLGTVLSMTLVVMTAQSLARDRELGTLEGLLATPVRPVEVLIGKLIPYIGIGVVQTIVILILARVLFDVPEMGGWDALVVGTALFTTGSLALGFLISTIARTQRDAQLMAQLYFMPSFLLSGFIFPFVGMPQWAQVLGSLVPVTYFLRIVRGSLLKGQGLAVDWSSLAALGLFTVAVSALAILRYRTTLD